MEKCLTCPALLNFFNICPMVLWTIPSTERQIDSIDRVLDYIMVSAGVFNVLTILGVVFGLIFYRTTRAFCLSACLGITYVLCNNLSNSLNLQRPIGTRNLLRKLRFDKEWFPKPFISFLRVFGYVVSFGELSVVGGNAL